MHGDVVPRGRVQIHNQPQPEGDASPHSLPCGGCWAFYTLRKIGTSLRMADEGDYASRALPRSALCATAWAVRPSPLALSHPE